ncbi:glucokinase [Roseibacterium sp. SDUM158017]|uniref:glucokinase n=1 Tax=Roseicyclus salinarum TaxID=3036773 RepID=UPI002414F14D|nr:glucokinase [Roseibacterium sp. SDUM158017]MDG4647620.1 glucokinase [Roseibacterium sp. SDUM158017]
MTTTKPGLSLVADIGGTNTRVALARGPVVDAASVTRFRNAEHSGIASVITTYLAQRGIGEAMIDGVCVAAAGPVRDGVAQLTNLDWRIDREVLAEALTATTSAVLNDLQAQGHAIGHIADDNLVEVLPQPPHSPLAAKLVVGIGTGFNACPVFDTEAGRFVPPSEAGHVSLPGSVPDLRPVLSKITDSHGFPPVEEVLSGRGVSTLHAALHGTTLAAADVLAGMDARDPAALETGRLFVNVMGAVIGDLALGHLPFGGIYLIGGVTRAFQPWLAEFGFAEAFRGKGRFSEFMEGFGVQVVTDDYAALTGCASHLSRL